ASDGFRVIRMAAEYSWSNSGIASRSKRAVRSCSVSMCSAAVSVESCTADCDCSCAVPSDEALSVPWCCVSGKPLLSRTGLPLSVPVGSPMVTEYEYVGSENTLLCGRSPGTSSPVRVASVGWQLSIPCPTSRLPNTFHITTRFVCCGHGRKGTPRDRGADTATSHIRTALVRAQRGQRLLR